MKKSAPGKKARRSTRVLLEIPILVEGVDAQGKRFEELGHTEVVNKHGAKIRCPRDVALNSEIIITLTQSGRTSRAVVVWTESSDSGGHRDHYGIRLQKAENFWGIYFPPSDWQEADAWQDEGEEPQGIPTPAAPASEPSSAVGVLVGPGKLDVPAIHAPSPLPAPPPSSQSSGPPLELPTQGREVVVRGMSAARMPFQEDSYVEPVSDTEATIGLRAVVDIGAVLQLIFPDLNRAVKVRTTSVSDRPVKDRWKMWVNLPEPVKLVDGS